MATFDSFIKQWSTTPASNGTTPNIVPYGWPEGMPPSAVNNTARQQMSDHRYQWEDAQWFCWGDDCSKASTNSIKIASDVTSRYVANRRVKILDDTTLYATILSSSYSAPDTTINFDIDSGELATTSPQVALSIMTPNNSSLPGPKSGITVNNGRITLTSGVPVTVSDVTAATTVYFTPYLGNQVDLYDGTEWNRYSFAEISIAVPSTTSQMYDVYLYSNAGAVTMELVAWTNDTTRATDISLQDGVFVKSGDATRKYIGNIRTTGVSGQCEDSLAKRYVWNFFNKVRRPMAVIEATDTWTYSTNAFRQANGSTANQLDFITGTRTESVEASVVGEAITSTSTSRSVGVAIGSNSTTTKATNCVNNFFFCTNAIYALCVAHYKDYSQLGRQTLVWLEKGGGADTQTWYGDNGSVLFQSGIVGSIMG